MVGDTLAPHGRRLSVEKLLDRSGQLVDSGEPSVVQLDYDVRRHGGPHDGAEDLPNGPERQLTLCPTQAHRRLVQAASPGRVPGVHRTTGSDIVPSIAQSPQRGYTLCMSDDVTKYLGVRETAKRLGVHENTVRNWAKDGILPSAKLPGSRFHRFDARDVERLRQQRGEPVSSVGDDRLKIGPELVDASQLSAWATTRDAQSTFPELIRRLLASTPGITNVSMRSGDGVHAPGWDGYAESTGSSFLPSGHLYFELGVGRPQQKAAEDFAKRLRQSEGALPTDSNFVFVTPRRWSRSEEWTRKRREEGRFSDVRVIDADDLEAWLQATPAVHYWLSERLGQRPRDAETLERWWTKFREKTDPALPTSLFLAGREKQSDELVGFFNEPPSVLVVQADWRDDAMAFVHATIADIQMSRKARVQPSLVIFSADVWDRVIAQSGKMTLLPVFRDADIAAALEQGHYVILPTGKDDVVQRRSVSLPKPHRHAATEALESAGISTKRADKLAALARRSMPALVRSLARDPRFARPQWSRQPDAQVMAPLVMVGAWTTSENDTEVVSQIAGADWSSIERTLFDWSLTEDPPFVRSGSQWQLASADEAFLLLRDMLTRNDVERWRKLAVKVLLETDPARERAQDGPSEDVFGPTRQYSGVLRRGLAQGLALIGSVGDEQPASGIVSEQLAAAAVQEILGSAQRDEAGVVWQSLADVLPPLAEAAPEAFLDAVHNDLDRARPLLANMFIDYQEDTLRQPSSPHPSLLWALETLCWSENYLLEASRALARLCSVDPGGRLVNRPINSLSNVLVGWVRQTSAPLDLRKRTLTQLCARMPEVGWRVILELWPSSHEIAFPPASPRFRDWSPESSAVSIAEWIEYIDHLTTLAIDLAGDDITRWADLVEKLGPLPPTQRARLITTIEQVADPSVMEDDERVAFWERLQKEIDRHRHYSSAQWSMDASILERLQEIADRIEPLENVERRGYLFDWRPRIPGVDPRDREAYDRALRTLRVKAVREALSETGMDGLRALAARSPVPDQLGLTLASVLSDEHNAELLSWLGAPDDNLHRVAEGWARCRLSERGVDWLTSALERPDAMTEAGRKALVLCAPERNDTWDALTQLDPNLEESYWEHMNALRVEPADADRAVRELVAHGRAWDAAELLSMTIATRGIESLIAPDLVRAALDAALDVAPNDSLGHHIGYEIGQLLDYLEKHSTDSAVLARYEFVFYQLLEYNREPRALFGVLGRDSDQFVDLVKRVYRGKSEARRRLSADDEALARHAWWVLRQWRGLPGLTENGTIDAQHLRNWVRDARLAFADSDRADIGDEQIGQVLASSPVGSDDIWPAEPVREIIETIGSTSLETGLHIGAVNRRGVTTRGVYDGGQLERDLAARYQRWAKATAGEWPRNSRVLRRLSESYQREAAQMDARAEEEGDSY